MAGDDEVGQFANIAGSHYDDCLECCARLFYHLPREKTAGQTGAVLRVNRP